jgi:hypothetical protein
MLDVNTLFSQHMRRPRGKLIKVENELSMGFLEIGKPRRVFLYKNNVYECYRARREAQNLSRE